MRLVREVAALAPALGGDGVVLGLVQPDLVARVGPVLRNERIEKLSQREAGLVEVRIGRCDVQGRLEPARALRGGLRQGGGGMAEKRPPL